MNFKKTILLLSLSAVSAFAAAAPAVPAPTPLAPVNLLQGAPAYLLAGVNMDWGFFAYTPLIDNDRVQRGGIPQGAWTNKGLSTQLYAVDLTGAPCMDKFGSCTATPGKGAVEMNTVVVYFEQPIGAEVEPSDTTLLGDPYKVDIWLDGYEGSEPGVTLTTIMNRDNQNIRGPQPYTDAEWSQQWKSLGEVKRNNLVKRTFTFPAKKYSKLRLEVRHSVFDPINYWNPTVVHMEAFNLPAAPAQP